MAALTESDIEKLFSGAPQYCARSEGHFTGAPHPLVAFPYDEELAIRDLTDHIHIADSAWSCVTAWPHITRDAGARRSSIPAHRNSGSFSETASRGAEGSHVVGDDASSGPGSGWAMKCPGRQRAHFYPRCRERPSMLSGQGLEKGTMGYQAALESAVADALQEPQFGFDGVGYRANAIVEAQQRLLSSKDGLRHMEEADILTSLIKMAKRYREGLLPRAQQGSRSSPSDLYDELFGTLLHPPAKVLDRKDPKSLSGQIQQLLRILKTPNVWIDFEQVAWRIRLGQILWGGDSDDDVGAEPPPGAGRIRERYWLLLQILLACELIIRLDAITEGEELGAESIKPAEVHKFERDANTSVKWSLILARCWLENIEVVVQDEPADRASHAVPQPTPQPTPHPTTHFSSRASWLTALAGRIPLVHHDAPASKPPPPPSLPPPPQPSFTIRGRFDQRQVNGLTHFARKLHWPGIAGLGTRIPDTCRKAITDDTPVVTPAGTTTPLTSSSRRSGYFTRFHGGGAKATPASTPGQRRRTLARAALRQSGWLSKSFVSGLVLPGEGLSHIMMATLLENDLQALLRLGTTASLCGGFVYGHRSFWSVRCIVGRVLAAGWGAAECLGWVSSPVTPLGLGEGWLDVEVQELDDAVLKTGRNARLWDKARIERESRILGPSDEKSVLPADFIIPLEKHYPRPPPELEITIKSLDLLVPPGATPTPAATITDAGTDATSLSEDVNHLIPTVPATITFTVVETQAEGVAEGGAAEGAAADVREYEFELRHDVHFVTAHPCVPCRRVRLMRSPGSPTIQQIDVTDQTRQSPPGGATAATGHPLHKSFTYTVVHLSELLRRYRTSSLRDLLAHTINTPRRASQLPANQDPTPRVLVVDCITGFAGRPHQPSRRRASSSSILSPDTPMVPGGSADATFSRATENMHLESRERRFGSDMEMLARALCAEKGWCALVSRRRRGCLACAIREAGALGWGVIIRVE